MQHKIKIIMVFQQKNRPFNLHIIFFQQAILGEVSNFLWLHADLNWFRILLLSFPGELSIAQQDVLWQQKTQILGASKRGNASRRRDVSVRARGMRLWAGQWVTVRESTLFSTDLGIFILSLPPRVKHYPFFGSRTLKIFACRGRKNASRRENVSSRTLGMKFTK